MLAGFDDPRERLTHSYRSWLLSALDRVDEAAAVAEDGLASAQRDRQSWAVHVFETWNGRNLLHLGRLDEANAVLEGRFRLADAHLIVGVLDAASVVALGRTKLHIGDERGAHEVAEIAKVMLTTTAPVVRRHAAWYLAVHAMTAGDPDQAHHWLCALGEAERLSLFPLFPMEAADDPLLVRMALAAGDAELAKAVTELGRAGRLNPGVASIAGAAAHARGLLSQSRAELEQAAAILAPGPRPLALAAVLEDLGHIRLAGGDGGGAADAVDRSCGSASMPEPRATRPEPASGYANSGSGAGSRRWTARNRAGSRSPTPSSRWRTWPRPGCAPTGGSPTGCSFHPAPA